MHLPSLRLRRLPSFLPLVVIALWALVLLVPGRALAVPGAIDTTYGSNGHAAALGSSMLSIGAASTQQPDGKLLVAGAKSTIDLDLEPFSFDLRVHPVVTRTNVDGSRDDSWGDAGVATIYTQNHLALVTAIDARADGSVLVTGVNVGLFSLSTFVAKLDAAGKLDASFGVDGIVTALPEDMNLLVPVAVHAMPDGGALVVADSFSGDLFTLDAHRKRRADIDIVLLRYTAAGRLMAGFGTDGMLRYDTSGTDSLDIALVASFDAAGGATVGGVAINDGLTYARALVVRFTADGVLDPAFGTRGVSWTAPKSHRYDIVTALERRSDGGVTLGVARLDEDDDVVTTHVRRLDANGVPARFPGGAADTTLPGELLPTALLTLADGRTIVSGFGSRGGLESAFGGHGRAAVTRLDARGIVETSFERGGVAYEGIDDDFLRSSVASGLHAGPDGTIVVAGTFSGVAGSIRLLGDSPRSVRTRPVAVSLQVLGAQGGPTCGARRVRHCTVDRRRKGPVTLRIRTSGVPVGTRMLVLEEYDSYGWELERTIKVRVTRRGIMDVPITAARASEYGMLRYRVEVPATPDSQSAEAPPRYVHVWHRVEVYPGNLPRSARPAAATAAVASMGVAARRDPCTQGSGLLALDVQAVCREARVATAGPNDWRTKALRWLGR